MDKGAHFYKCDFQVHTPRDINWTGKRPIIESARIEYAESFVAKCREVGLQAVAITDHHDFAFFKFIKQASINELDTLGKPLSKEARLVVFPGIEITLSNPPVQVLLILDANFPEDQFTRVLNKLSLNPNPDHQPTTAAVNAISNTVIKDINDLYEQLDSVDIVKGKYIILPNVTETGHKTLLRSGFAEHYRKMSCVGGYVDGSISKQGEGHKNIVSGQDRNYGYKRIALFHTSDNRSDVFDKLGIHATWVKWAEPTGEALRQACLAQESRVSILEPEVPQIWITSIDVTNSKYLGGFDIDLNPQYNAIIGGRGTGKSTILEYLRWVLCDQTNNNFDIDEIGDIERKRQNLISKTLIPYGGEVRITFVVNGIKHIVKRNSKSKELQLKIDGEEFKSVKEEDVRLLLPIQAYSQKQLSDVGIKNEELNRFIEQPIKLKLDTLKFAISELSNKTKITYGKLTRRKEIEIEINKLDLELSSLNTQAENLRKSLKGMSEEDQVIISKKQKYDQEKIIVDSNRNQFKIIEGELDSLISLINKYPNRTQTSATLENNELINEIYKESYSQLNLLKEAVGSIKNSLSSQSNSKINDLYEEWEQRNMDFDISYELAKQNASSNQQQLQEIQRIERRVTELNSIVNGRKDLLKSLGDPTNEFEAERNRWVELHEKKVNLLDNEATKFSTLSKNLIRAEISKSIDVGKIKLDLQNFLQGTRIRENLFDNLIKRVEDAEEPLIMWVKILSELRLLAELKISEDKTETLPNTPMLSSSGFNDSQKIKISDLLTPDKWLMLANNEVTFEPKFYYSTNTELSDYIPFSDASAGQQATALLTVLLSQPGTPLVIDQPEDDIDNRAIDDIIKNIWNAKLKRQLIFTSHNANLVVNGDAELVICCDNKESGDQTRGIIKAQGAIDTRMVRDEITSVMEGGERAFKLRKDKYGF
jgi:type III restriction enzyme